MKVVPLPPPSCIISLWIYGISEAKSLWAPCNLIEPGERIWCTEMLKKQKPHGFSIIYYAPSHPQFPFICHTLRMQKSNLEISRWHPLYCSISGTRHRLADMSAWRVHVKLRVMLPWRIWGFSLNAPNAKARGPWLMKCLAVWCRAERDLGEQVWSNRKWF